MRVRRFIDRDLRERKLVSLDDGDVYKTRSKVYDVVRYEGFSLFKCERCSLNRNNKICRRIDCRDVVLVKRD